MRLLDPVAVGSSGADPDNHTDIQGVHLPGTWSCLVERIIMKRVRLQGLNLAIPMRRFPHHHLHPHQRQYAILNNQSAPQIQLLPLIAYADSILRRRPHNSVSSNDRVDVRKYYGRLLGMSNRFSKATKVVERGRGSHCRESIQSDMRSIYSTNEAAKGRQPHQVY